jgi:outer membrane biosynthesis protein TonB
MIQKRALTISLVIHVALFGLLLTRMEWFSKKPKENMAIEARLVIKKQKNKNHLPHKIKPIPSQIEPKPEEEKKADQSNPPPEQKKSEEVPVMETAKKAAAKKSMPDYTKALAALSNSFREELEKIQPKEPEAEVITDSTYFDQVYSLIKESFVVPPHINGPQGKHLRAELRILLLADGSLMNVDLISPSGDEHFDKAIIDGTRRVNNFGLVPLPLQNLMKERGIIVELCPFTCQD